MQIAQAFLKRFVELGTNSAHRLGRDLFFRTEVVITGLLFFLCLTNIIIVTVSIDKLHFEIASLIIDSVTTMLTSGNLNPSIVSPEIIASLHQIRDQYVIIAGTASIIITLILGYIAARVALIPTKNALISQKQFIGNIAHELRTPLSIVRANEENMLFELKKNPALTAMAISNLEELDRIAGIINNLLSLNAFHHVEGIEFSPVNIGNVLKSATEATKQLALSKGISIEQHIDHTELAWGNESGLLQIAINIIKNAIIYTPKNGQVTIATGSRSDLYVSFEISDTGVGIEKEKLERIFEPFYQINTSRSKIGGGSGLGLAIVDELVKAHNGIITIKSIPHKGTKVFVQIPKQQKKGKELRH